MYYQIGFLLLHNKIYSNEELFEVLYDPLQLSEAILLEGKINCIFLFHVKVGKEMVYERKMEDVRERAGCEQKCPHTASEA